MSNEELVQLYQNGDVNALDELIGDNSRIVYKIANKYDGVNRELELGDLIQEGILGLIEAAKRYDFNNEKKAKFITYAVYYIDRYIYRAVNGRSTKEKGNNEFYHNCSSLNVPVGEEGTELGDLIEGVDYGYENIEEKLFLNNLRKELEEVMQTHNTLEQREILKFKYGWNSKPMKLDDIAEIYNITRDKVRKIEHIALRKLRHSSWAMNNIKEFAELGYISDFYLGIYRDCGIKV
ncbi:sigma-70 family RNA polymerase sigma factor [uncultured Clostridium sp.]|uniref:sigma-70 family RNA polymerase sigma factor n=1 Tax=uncultured Clostridium sp. TaxID=59620 RepID=UPI00280B3DDB|nr:sigma-70 family RNA polymerase sigma factor [uncultured Clostridium sp.]